MQAVVVIMSEKKNNAAPAIIAPIRLVASKVIASKIKDVRMVPKIPARKTGRFEQIQWDLRVMGDFKNANAR